MHEFNLLEEPWISVIVDDLGHTKLASMIDVFHSAHEYKALAGDMKAQDFSILRLLLAVLHTVFARYDTKGYARTFDPDEDEAEDFDEESIDIWKEVWQARCFPNIVCDYLDNWHNRFYLFDDEYPFMQVLAEDISSDKLKENKHKEKKPTPISGKYINRLISESNNKIALFSPKGNEKDKNHLTCAELARWLVTLQGYVGNLDKAFFDTKKYKVSKGWLFDLGGITLAGSNLFETLMLNWVAANPYQSAASVQKPCWEYSGAKNIQHAFSNTRVDNIAQLYTRWSRAVYIPSRKDENEPFTLSLVKLPDLDHKNAFIEPMTLWEYNKTGVNKDTFTPRKLRIKKPRVKKQRVKQQRTEEAMWRSYSLLTLTHSLDDSEKYHRPEVISWLDCISPCIENSHIVLEAISVKDNGSELSPVLTDEVYDNLYVHEELITDVGNDGWVYRVNHEINHTETAVSKTYEHFLQDMCDIQNRSDDNSATFIDRTINHVYFLLDRPFRDWLAGINPSDSKNECCDRWRATVKQLLKEEASQMVANANTRDLNGITVTEKTSGAATTKNIITAYNAFIYRLNKLSEQ